MAVQIDIRANSEQAKRSIDQLNNSVKNIETSTQNVNNSFKNLGRVANFAAAAIAAAFTGNAITRAADTYKEINSSLRLATRNAKELANAQRSINKITIETRGNLSSTANLFARLNRSAIQLGRSQQDTVKATRAISQAIQISGASAASAQAAIIQLGQGLASGTLRGEELNSVLEQTPRVAQAIAKELGVSLGQLRKIASEGKVTSEVVFDALVKQSAQINREFTSVSLTVGQAFNVLNTGATTFLAALDKSLGLSSALANRIQLVGKFLNDFGTEFEDRLSILQTRLVLFRMDVEDIFTKLFNKIQGLFDNLTFSNIGFEIESDAFNRAKAKFNEIGEELKKVSNFEIGIDFSGIKSSVDTVKTFVNSIYNYFYDLYIDLVGNSIVPDMVYAIIDQFLILKAEGIRVISGFISDIEGSFNKILEHELTQKGLSKLKSSINELKETSTFNKLESALSSAKEKAIEIGTTLKDAFNTTFSLSQETKTSLEAGLGTALIAAISAQGVVNAFKFAIQNGAKLAKPIAILTVTEAFGTQIAEKLSKINFTDLGKKLGAGFNEIANSASSSGTGNLISQLAAEALALIRGAFEGAFVDPSLKESFSNVIIGAFALALASGTIRSAIAGAFAFAFTGGTLSDRAGFGKNAKALDIEKPAEAARFKTQRLGGGVGALLAGLFVSGVVDELGGSAGEQITYAFAAALVGGAAATALTNAAISFSGKIITGLTAASAAAGLTAAGAAIAGGILTVLAGLGGALLFPEETQKLVRAVFGDAAGDFAKSIIQGLKDSVNFIAEAVAKGIGKFFLSPFSGGTTEQKLTPEGIAGRGTATTAIDQFRQSPQISSSDDAKLSRAITLIADSNLSNQEVAKNLREINSNNAAVTDLLNRLASALELIANPRRIDVEKRFANGGRVFGSGTSKSDSIPAYLSNGEYVVNAKATSRNLGLLSAINGGMNPGGNSGRFNDGGLASYLTKLIEFEGGYSNKKTDRGGETNFGITQTTYKGEGFSSRKGFPKGVKDLTLKQAEAFYSYFWKKNNIDRNFPKQLRHQGFDIVVNSGPGNTARMIQEHFGITGADGKPTNQFGSQTRKAIATLTNSELANIRIAYLKNLAKSDPIQGKPNEKGWLRRANYFKGYASGGKVTGPGTGRSDDIPAMLSNGEFVVNAKSTARNRGLLESINRQKFNNGGMAGKISALNPTAENLAPFLKELINITVDKNKFEKLTGASKETIKQALSALANTNERLQAATSSGNFERSAELLVEQEKLQKLLDNKLDDVVDAINKNAAPDGKTFAEKVMESINTKEAGRAAGEDFVANLRTAIIKGEGGGIKQLLNSFVDTFTKTIVNQFFEGMTKEVGNLTADLFKSNGPLSGGFSSIFSSIGGFFGMGGGGTLGYNDMSFELASGGMVPGPLGAPMPGIAHGGEMILNPTQQAAVFGDKTNSGSVDNVTVNLQVVGDVSMQTRKEVLNMMPEIANATQVTFAERRLIGDR